jgi:hypothetical protein
MKRILALAAVMGSLAFAAPSSHAAPAGILIGAQTASTSITRVGWYGHRCRFWRHECAARWPWLGWRFRRCLVIHGCGRW